MQISQGPEYFAESSSNKTGELFQFSFVEVGHRPISHVAMHPRKKIVPATRERDGRAVSTPNRWRDEEVNRVFVSLINERDHPLAVEIIESAANEREAVERKIVHIRREIDFAIEPGFDCVLVGRSNIDQMGG